MSGSTYQAVVENGQIKLPEGVHLPEKQLVYVVVPEHVQKLERAFAGFRLANPDDARHFEMQVTWGEEK
ncbi:MAG TPA: hypothetical protein PLX97_07980 [Gemmatales bacterium]|nr:hypothetical protein [Gemmatales bacterium]